MNDNYKVINSYNSTCYKHKSFALLKMREDALTDDKIR